MQHMFTASQGNMTHVNRCPPNSVAGYRQVYYNLLGKKAVKLAFILLWGFASCCA
jgi:hypothetical protein